MSNKIAKGSKRTFWNDLRVKNNYLYSELGEALGVSGSTVGNWFSGRSIPSPDNLKNVCDLFGINYDEGYERFVEANRAWDSERGHMIFDMYPDGHTKGEKKPKKVTKKVGRKKKTAESGLTDLSELTPIESLAVVSVEPSATKLCEEVIVEEDSTTNTVLDTPKASFSVLEYFYGKLGYDEYENLRTFVVSGGNPLQLLYGKLGFDEYDKIDSLIKG